MKNLVLPTAAASQETRSEPSAPRPLLQASWLFNMNATMCATTFGYLAQADAPAPFPDGCGYGLPVVYLVWLGVVLILYPACRWFAGAKRRRRAAWLSYL